jgi:hypothetical protein
MASEEFTDYQQTGPSTFSGWRCLSCGLILDPVIIDHLARHHDEERLSLFKETLEGVSR